MLNDTGTLYWITGLSGAGKTTIGTALFARLKAANPATVMLDGDVLKNILGPGLGYDRAARLEKATRYAALCHELVLQGIDVVICTISMFDSVRDWNRRNNARYIEVFLNVSMDILRQRDKNGLYSRKLVDGQVVGLDYEAEFPKNPDLVFANGGEQSAEAIALEILDFVHVRQ